MSGSPGNTSSGAGGGRTPRHGRDDITARHAQGTPDQHTSRTDASTDARAASPDREDSRVTDPDKPEGE